MLMERRTELTINGNITGVYEEESNDTITTIKVLSSEGVTKDHLSNLQANFPVLTTIDISLGYDSSHVPPLTFETVLSTLWKTPLQKLHMSYVEIDSTSHDWTSIGQPILLETLQELVVTETDLDLPSDFLSFLATNSVTLQNLQVLKVDSCLDETLLTKLQPSLQQLSLKLSKSVDILNFPHLTTLTVKIGKVPKRSDLTINGKLPSLVSFELYSRVDVTSHIGDRLLNSSNLTSVTISHPNGFQILDTQLNSWKLAGICPNLKINVVGTIRPCRKSVDMVEFDWQVFQTALGIGCKVHPDSVVQIMNTIEKFENVKVILQKVDNLELDLEEERHDYLLQKLSKLSIFNNLTKLDLFHANEVSSKEFSDFLKSSNSIKHISMVNSHNPNFSHMEARSVTLMSLTLLHFHCLLTVSLDLPVLESLRFDNCDGESFPGKQHPSSYETYGLPNSCRCYGNLCERVLKDLLDGAQHIKIPNLKKLELWHNSNCHGGSPPVYEELRIDVECRVGHQTLEDISIYNCRHLRKLTLRSVPLLMKLSVSDQAEDEENFWLENVKLELPIGCESTVENIVLNEKMGFSLKSTSFQNPDYEKYE